MNSNQNYISMASALRDRLSIIGDRALRESNPELQLEKLQQVSELIRGLQENLPEDCNPHLNHYLQNCSYDKALAYLENLIRTF